MRLMTCRALGKAMILCWFCAGFLLVFFWFFNVHSKFLYISKIPFLPHLLIKHLLNHKKCIYINSLTKFLNSISLTPRKNHKCISVWGIGVWAIRPYGKGERSPLPSCWSSPHLRGGQSDGFKVNCRLSPSMRVTVISK